MLPEIWSVTLFFLVILGHFLFFHPFNNLENQSFKKMKKKPGDIILLHMCNINEDHMMYGSWDIRHDGKSFLSFRAFFYPLTLKKTKFWKMRKKTPGDIIILHFYITNYDSLMYHSWDVECDRQNFLSFWAIFCPFTPLTTQKIKILKKWKKS